MVSVNKMFLPDVIYKRLFFYTRVILLIVVAYPALKNYFNVGPLFIGGLFIAIYSLQPTPVQARRHWWLLPLGICLYLSTEGVKTLYFISCILTLGWLIENYYGKINLLPIIALMVISPAGDYLFNTLTFPFRLHLTHWVTTCLNAVGYPVNATGNLITFKGVAFSIDEACSGLKMLEGSILMMTLLLAHISKKNNHRLNSFEIIKWLVITILLALLANFFRIILLVIFQIGPEHPFHYTIGIICLIGYCIFPLLFSVSKYCKSKSAKSEETITTTATNGFHVFSLLLVGIVAFAGYFVKSGPSPVNQEITITGFKSENLKHGIVKLSNEKTLIYLKPLKNFYSTDHNPSICWKGSGYKMDFFTMKNIGGKKFFYGVLTNKKDKIYTAWWYQSSFHLTTDQLEWRKRCLANNESFWLVNISASTQQELNFQIQQFIENKNNSFYDCK